MAFPYRRVSSFPKSIFNMLIPYILGNIIPNYSLTGMAMKIFKCLLHIWHGPKAQDKEKQTG